MSDAEQLRAEFAAWFELEYPAGENGARPKYRDSNVGQLMQSAYQAGRAAAGKEIERLSDENAMLKAERDAFRHGHRVASDNCVQLENELRRIKLDLEDARKESNK